MIFCEQCGNKLNDNAKFCGKCGTPVNAAQTETRAADAPADGESPVDKAFNAGVACIEAERYDEAIAHFTETIRLKPDASGAYYKRGLIYGTIKEEYDRAIADFTTALQFANKKEVIYFARGQIYNAKQQYGNAIIDLNQAIQLNPNEAEYYGIRGMAYLESGDTDNACADCERGLQIDPSEETLIDLAHAIDEAEEQGGMSAPSACAQCGAPLEEGEAFCANCGAKIGAAPTQAPRYHGAPSKDATAFFSMTIEDVFFISGRGTVVTGTIAAGSIRLNEEVIIRGGIQEISTIVTGIEQFNKLLNEAKAGDNVGLTLKKVKKEDIKRGYTVTVKENYAAQAQRQAGGGEVLKESSLLGLNGFLADKKQIRGTGYLLLYHDRLEWKDISLESVEKNIDFAAYLSLDTLTSNFTIPFSLMSTVKFGGFTKLLTITMADNTIYSFSFFDVDENGINVPNMGQKMKSLCDAINSVRNGTLG